MIDSVAEMILFSGIDTSLFVQTIECKLWCYHVKSIPPLKISDQITIILL